MTALSLHPVGVEVRDRGLGPSADAWRVALHESRPARSVSVEDWRSQALADLTLVFSESSVPGWDGYDAAPVSVEAFEYARTLLSLLAGRVARPDISPHPDGEIALEWEADRSRHFTVAVGRDGTLTYYGAFGVAVSKGIEMLGDSVPFRVLEGIQRVRHDG